ncbi:hypothetical protein [Luteolibacter sp. Populi]|uniref:hypothetical protein n=1 Tax=Luteolibacter sp. Populi TaxID=3230487 RepID=UPI003467BAFC
MQRLTLLAAGAVLLGTAILLTRPAGNPPRAREPGRAGRTHGDPFPAALSGEGDLRSGDRHASREPDTHDPFRDQARLIAAMPQDTARENAVRELAQGWASKAPAAAERWAASLADPSERERALTHVSLGGAALDPRGAIRIAQVNQLHQGIVEAIATRWAAADFEAALSWAEESPRGAGSDRVFSQLVQARAVTAPAEAAAMLSESALSGAPHEEAAVAIVHQWLLKDPEAVRQWVDRFPEGPVKDRAMGEIQEMKSLGNSSR